MPARGRGKHIQVNVHIPEHRVPYTEQYEASATIADVVKRYRVQYLRDRPGAAVFCYVRPHAHGGNFAPTPFASMHNLQKSFGCDGSLDLVVCQESAFG